MRLVYKETGKEVKVGDKVTLHDGVIAVVTYFREPTSPASSGKVNVLVQGAEYEDEFYVGVIGAKWIEREDRDEVA